MKIIKVVVNTTMSKKQSIDNMMIKGLPRDATVDLLRMKSVRSSTNQVEVLPVKKKSQLQLLWVPK